VIAVESVARSDVFAFAASAASSLWLSDTFTSTASKTGNEPPF
jgi:hypothetical protein